MIIEIAGLPGTGKSTLADALSVRTGLPVIRLRSKIVIVILGGLFFLRYPRTFVSLKRMLERSAHGNLSLARSLVLNACIAAGAKYMYARMRGGIIDQGLVHALLSALPTSTSEASEALRFMPTPDLLVFREATTEVRVHRLKVRGRLPREEFSPAEAARWESEAPTAYEHVKAAVQALDWDPLMLSSETEDATEEIVRRLPLPGGGAIHTFFKSLSYAFAYGLRTITRPFSRNAEVAVLMYHAVASSSWKHAIEPQEFDRQMQYIAIHTKPVPLQEIVSHAQGEILLTERSVAVTFDDGYADLVPAVLPILEKYAIPMTLFLTTDLQADTHPGDMHRVSAEDLAVLVEHPLVTIESHAQTHRRLTRLSACDVTEELKNSKIDITTMTGRTPLYFAYPYGGRSTFVEQETKDAGYTAAFSITEGLVRPGNDLFRIKRIQVDRTMSFFLFTVRLTRAVDFHHAVVSWFRPRV